MRSFLKKTLVITLMLISANQVVVAQGPQIKQALLLINKGQNKEAVEYLLQIVNEYPKTAELRYLLAMALDKNGQTDMAIEEAKSVVTMKPKYKDNRRLLMDLYIKKENFKNAMEECQFLLKESKKDIGLKLNLCEIYLGLENYKDASTELAKLEVEKPNDNLVLTLLGDAYAKQRVNSLAIQYYNKALGVNPNAVNTKLK
ncbi:MAG TPA: tetratricopeptide repeat protein, partial [bacterium]|nr:tetratricopeptide repeat protein [bacterium]